MRTDPHAVKTLEKRTVRFASAGSPVLSRRLTGEHVEYGLMGAARKASLKRPMVSKGDGFVGAAYMRPMSGGEKRQGRIYATPTDQSNFTGRDNPPYPPLSGGQERATPLVERSTINSPLEGVGLSPREARQRPSGLCEGRCGGGSFYPWHVPPPNRLRASPLALRRSSRGESPTPSRGELILFCGGCFFIPP